MKKVLIAFAALSMDVICFSQNVGIGTITPAEKLHVVGNRVLLDVNYVGIGTGAPVTGSSYFQINNPINSYVGMYCNSGPTGLPFYGYALNGTARAYHQFNGNTNAYEYYQSNGGVPDYYISGNTKAVFNTAFVGIGTSTPTTGFTGFSLSSSSNNYWGMYVDAGSTGLPFYGYALNGNPRAFHQFNGTSNAFEYYQSNNSIPDFLINSNTKAVFNTAFVGIGTSTPTTGFTGFAMKSNVNSFYGSYIDAGPSGVPFYGYALNGTARAYGAFNGTNNAYEYHQTSDAIPDFLVNGNVKAVFNTAFVGIGTSTPTTGFTGFAMKSNVNSFYGSYVDAGPTGVPFYGYALNGTATAYTTFNGGTNQFEYHHTSDATPDFAVSNTQVLFPIQTFLGLGTSLPTTGSATGFTMKKNTNGFYGMYIDAGATGEPFYGYALNGNSVGWTEVNGGTNNWELHYGGTSISVTTSGFVGMGTGSPAQKLDVNGNIRCVSLTQTSDVRFKENIEPLEQSLDKIKKLNGVTWNWKTKEYPEKEFSGDRQIGFVAQDVEKIIPELVYTDKEGYKSIDYAKMTAILTEAVKAQQKQLDKQESDKKALMNKIDLLYKRIEALEKRQ